MSLFKEINEEISITLLKLPYKSGDLSDIGNEIGLIIGKFIDNDKLGFELDDFISGIKHGISIIEGTHDN